MKWKRIAGFLVLGLVVSGFLPSGDTTALSCLIPDVRSEGLFRIPIVSGSLSLFAEERQLFAFVNRERMKKGLRPLDMDVNLMTLARQHSEEMADQGFISHDKPSGDLQTRMNRAGYLFEIAKENVASSQTVSRAHVALFKSPPHKKNILSSDVTHLGIGVVRRPSPCGHYLYITQLFATPREAYRPEAVRNMLEDRIRKLQTVSNTTMAPDPLLEKLASHSLLTLKTPYDRTDLRNLLAASASELQEQGENGLSRLQVSVQLLHDPKKLSLPPSGGEGPARKYGTAVRQITDNRNQPAFLVLTLLGIAR